MNNRVAVVAIGGNSLIKDGWNVIPGKGGLR